MSEVKYPPPPKARTCIGRKAWEGKAPAEPVTSTFAPPRSSGLMHEASD
jgi:hypothetical protein